MMTALGTGLSPQACLQARIRRLSRRRHRPSRVQRANRVYSVPNGSVRSQGSLPRVPPADRFSDPVLRDQESRHELPALPIIVDRRAGSANGTWLPALPVPGVRAAIQRADRHSAEPGPGPNRHRVPRGLLAAALQAEPAGSGRDVPDPGPRVHPRGGARACCTEEEEAREPPFPTADQATRTEFGHPRSSIRLRTWAAMATSVARALSLWKRSPSPMTCFQRANWPSTRALSL